MGKNDEEFKYPEFKFIDMPYNNGIILGIFRDITETKLLSMIAGEEGSPAAVYKAVMDHKEKLKQDGLYEINIKVVAKQMRFYAIIPFRITHIIENSYPRKPMVSITSIKPEHWEDRHKLVLEDFYESKDFTIRLVQGHYGVYLVSERDQAMEALGDDVSYMVKYEKRLTLGRAIDYLENRCGRDFHEDGMPFAYTCTRTEFPFREDEVTFLRHLLNLMGPNQIYAVTLNHSNDLTAQAFYKALQWVRRGKLYEEGEGPTDYHIHEVYKRLSVRKGVTMASNTLKYYYSEMRALKAIKDAKKKGK